MKDVRDFLTKQLAELADSDATPEEMELRIKRANATTQVANTYVATVKTEIDAIRAFESCGSLPAAIEPPRAAK